MFLVPDGWSDDRLAALSTVIRWGLVFLALAGVLLVRWDQVISDRIAALHKSGTEEAPDITATPAVAPAVEKPLAIDEIPQSVRLADGRERVGNTFEGQPTLLLEAAQQYETMRAKGDKNATFESATRLVKMLDEALSDQSITGAEGNMISPEFAGNIYRAASEAATEVGEKLLALVLAQRAYNHGHIASSRSQLYLAYMNLGRKDEAEKLCVDARAHPGADTDEFFRLIATIKWAKAAKR